MKNIFKAKNRIIANLLYPILAVVVLFFLWWLVAFLEKNPLILPTPIEVFGSLGELMSASDFWISTGYTLLRTVICFAISLVLAFLLAALSGLFKPLSKILNVLASCLRSAPTMAIILIVMLWLDENSSAVVIGFLIAFPILYQSIYTSITMVDKDLIEMTKIFKLRKKDVVFGLYIPQIAPSVFDVSASTLSLTLKVVIASEVMAYVRNSIGLGMQHAKSSFEIATLLAWTVFAIIISFLLEGIVKGLKKLWEVRR